jgi:hypothetical protein
MDAVGIRLRESPRIEVAGRARLRVGSVPALMEAALLDLSATGMGLATAVATPRPVPGEACAFDLALDGLRVEGRGVVIWSRRARPDRGDAANVGVHFERIDSGGEEQIAAMVEQGLLAMRRPSVLSRRAFIAPEPARSAEVAVDPAAAREQATIASAEPMAVAAAAPQVVTVAEPPAAPATAPDVAMSSAAPAPAGEAGDVLSTPGPVEEELPAHRLDPLPAAAPETRPPRERHVETFAAPARRPAMAWLAVGGVAVLAAAIAALWTFFAEPGPTSTATTIDAAPVTGESAASSLVPESAQPAPVAAADDDATELSAPGGAVALRAVAGAAENVVERGAAPAIAVDAAAPEPAPAAPQRTAPTAVSSAAAGGDATARASGLVAIEPGVEAGGGEVVVLRGDAAFRQRDVFATLMGPEPPRYLLRLSGIEQQWRPPDLEVGSPLIQRVRTGLHSTPRGLELHVVLDLTSRAVDHSWEVDGDALRVHLRPRTP